MMTFKERTQVAVITVNSAGTIQSMKTAEQKIDEAAGRALGMVAGQLERQAKINAYGPVTQSGPHQDWAGEGPNRRSGDLHKHIKSSRPIRIGFGSYEAEVTSPMFYSRWVEEGTSRSGNYPFMRPAFDTLKQKADRIFMMYYRKFRGN
jgi:HK97 gp10 family phage protein